jgi:hypothetical protein
MSAVNFIRLNNSQFKAFFKDTESEFGDIAYCSEVQWVIKGKVRRQRLALFIGPNRVGFYLRTETESNL